MSLKNIYFILFCSTLLLYAGIQDTAIQIGAEAPTFSLPTIDHKYISLRDFCGKKLRKPWKNNVKNVVVLSFFATWCKPCMKEIPLLEKLMTEFADLPVRFYLIDVGEDRDKITKFIKNKNIRIPVLLDRYQKTAEKYDALTLPRLIVIDKNGMIQQEMKGFKDAESFENDLTELLKKLIADS
jgi:peroxiredoxin